jgi:hypothetical protein
MEVINKMKQNLNDIMGRIQAARIGEWHNLLADRWRFCILDDLTKTRDPLCPIVSNAP